MRIWVEEDEVGDDDEDAAEAMVYVHPMRTIRVSHCQPEKGSMLAAVGGSNADVDGGTGGGAALLARLWAMGCAVASCALIVVDVDGNRAGSRGTVTPWARWSGSREESRSDRDT